MLQMKSKPASSSSSKQQKADQQSNVPPLVNKVLSTPGNKLDNEARTFFEPRFGHDFSKIRVHNDDLAARSALQLGAKAYTVGQDVVFGAGYYEPETQAGRALIAHELTHAVQQKDVASSAPVNIAPAYDASEHVAERVSKHINEPDKAASISSEIDASSAMVPGKTVQRSMLDSLIGGIAGAGLGAAIGGIIGGPIGAIVGGVAGFIGGALLVDNDTTSSRKLTPTEISYAEKIFKTSIDYSKITITKDSVISLGAPRTIANTIHLKSNWGHFKENTMELTDQGIETLIHEMGHVWQYQNNGLSYIPKSLYAQAKNFFQGKSRNAAYNWQEAVKAKLPWEDWNPEQQAEAIEDYNKNLQTSKTPPVDFSVFVILATLLPYMEKVWGRKGAA